MAAEIVTVEVQIVPKGSGQELPVLSSSKVFGINVEGYEKEFEYEKSYQANLHNLIFKDIQVSGGVFDIDFDFGSSEVGLASILVCAIDDEAGVLRSYIYLGADDN